MLSSGGQTLTAGIGISIDSQSAIQNTKPMAAITMFDNGVTENTLTGVAGIKFPASWTYLYSSNLLHLYQPSIPDPLSIVVNSTAYTPETINFSGFSAANNGTTLSLSATHNYYTAGYGLSLSGNTFSNTKPARVLTVGGVSYGDNVVQVTWNGVTGSLANDHLTLTAGGISGIPDGTVSAGSLQVAGLLTAATSLQVQADASVIGTLTTNTANVAQLTVTSSATIPGYHPHMKYTQTTGSEGYTAATGTWSVWPYPFSEHMFIGNPGHQVGSTTNGVNVAESETVTYLKKDLTCYLALHTHSSSGYCDCYVVNAAGQETFTTRINTHQPVSNGYIQTAGPTFQFDGEQIACLCSGFASYTHVRSQCRKGALMIGGLGWTSEVNVPPTPHSIVHSDKVVGKLGSLSDERIKSGVTALDPTTCLSLCNTLAPCAYLRTDQEPTEIRTGLIAQEVDAALTAYSMPTLPVVCSRWASVDPGSFDEPGSAPEELMTVCYERLVPFLLGAVQRLTERVTQLEA